MFYGEKFFQKLAYYWNRGREKDGLPKVPWRANVSMAM